MREGEDFMSSFKTEAGFWVAGSNLPEGKQVPRILTNAFINFPDEKEEAQKLGVPFWSLPKANAIVPYVCPSNCPECETLRGEGGKCLLELGMTTMTPFERFIEFFKMKFNSKETKKLQKKAAVNRFERHANETYWEAYKRYKKTYEEAVANGHRFNADDRCHNLWMGLRFKPVDKLQMKSHFDINKAG